MIRNGEAGESDQLILYKRAANGAAEKMSGAHVHTCPQAHTQTPTRERERDKSQAMTRETRGPRQETVGFIWHNLVTMELHGRRGIHVREQQHLT